MAGDARGVRGLADGLRPLRQWRDIGVFAALMEGMIAGAARRGQADMPLVSVDSLPDEHVDQADCRVGDVDGDFARPGGGIGQLSQPQYLRRAKAGYLDSFHRPSCYARLLRCWHASLTQCAPEVFRPLPSSRAALGTGTVLGTDGHKAFGFSRLSWPPAGGTG
jgi:hypothetical protein